MMKKVVIALCVMAMSSIAIADMTQDFESMVTSDLYTSGEFRDGWPWYWGDSASIVSGVYGNTTKMVGIHGYSSVEYHAQAGEQLSEASIEFDICYDTVSANRLQIRDSSGWNVVNFLMQGGYGDVGIYDLVIDGSYTAYFSSATFVDVFTPGTWYNVEIAMNMNYELTNVFIDGSPLFLGMDTMQNGITGSVNHSGQTLTMARHFQWTGWQPPGDYIYLDDYSVYVPEPATCLLLLGGAMLLRRRKRA